MVRFSFIRPFFRRKHSQQSSTLTDDSASQASNTAASTRSADPGPFARRLRRLSAASLNNKPRSRRNPPPEHPEPVPEQRESLLLLSQDDDKSPQISSDELPTPDHPATRPGSETLAAQEDRTLERSSQETTPITTPSTAADDPTRETDGGPIGKTPTLVLQEPTPGAEEAASPPSVSHQDEVITLPELPQAGPEKPTEPTVALADPPRRSSSQVSPGDSSSVAEAEERRQSIANSSNAKIVKTLVDAPEKNKDSLQLDTNDSAPLTSGVLDFLTPGLPDMSSMLHRKIWVKRPGASATLVQIKEEDLVDDVRDMILKKYANSLGKTFDAPDMLLRIVSRADHGQPRTDRVLGPEEQMCRTIDSYFPGGQTVDDALVIDVPPKRTPRPSPRMYQYPAHYSMEDQRPMESGTDYFPPMPAIVHPTMPMTSVSHDSRGSNHGDHQRSISVLSTGQVPPLPSPGGTRRHREHRPKFNRQHTSSPTIVQHNSNAGAVAIAPSGTLLPQQPQLHSHRASLRPRTESNASEHPRPLMPNGAPATAPVPTPPIPENAAAGSNPPTPATSQTAQAPRTSRPKKNGKKSTPDKPGAKSRRDRNGSSESPQPSLISNMLDGSIPPINVLIVEDNIINLRILEGLMKRLKVRWETAMNGQIAVDKWRAGGFHLVLMDIQMPVMNGLAATKEIRRLEKVNGIGVFSSSAPSSPIEQRGNGKQNGDAENATNDDADKEAAKRKKSADKLPEATGGLFKSPIIIVALTASSLQSDRHEALAAGCNDFLTKPVNFVWLERKVKEWGCMQALIDFDGWRRWKDYASKEEEGKSEEQKRKEKEDEEKQKRKMEKLAILQERQKAKEEAKKRAEREKAEQEQQQQEGEEQHEEEKDSTPASAPAPASSEDVADKTDEKNGDTAAEVDKEKEEIETFGDKAPDAQEGDNPSNNAEPPALAPESIQEEAK
ncbi:hypothetical protein Q7P37_011218 [Cladosporium fusiforme]